MTLNKTSGQKSKKLLPISNQPLPLSLQNLNQSVDAEARLISGNIINTPQFGLEQLNDVERLYFEVDKKAPDGTDFSILNESGLRLFKTNHKVLSIITRGYDGTDEGKTIIEYPTTTQEILVKDAEGAIIMSSSKMNFDSKEYGATKITYRITILKIGGSKYGELEAPSHHGHSAEDCSCDNSYHLGSTLWGNFLFVPNTEHIICCECCISSYQIKQGGKEVVGVIKNGWSKERSGVFGISFPASMPINSKALLILASLNILHDSGGIGLRGSKTMCRLTWILSVLFGIITIIIIGTLSYNYI